MTARKLADRLGLLVRGLLLLNSYFVEDIARAGSLIITFKLRLLT